MFPHKPSKSIDKEHPEIAYLELFGKRLKSALFDDPLLPHNLPKPFKVHFDFGSVISNDKWKGFIGDMTA